MTEKAMVNKFARRAVGAIAGLIITLSVIPALMGLVAAGAMVFGNVSGEHGEYVDLLFSNGNTFIVAMVVCLVAWTVRAVIVALEQAVDLYDRIEARREIKAQVKAMLDYRS